MHETMDALSDAVLTSYAEEEAALGGEVRAAAPPLRSASQGRDGVEDEIVMAGRGVRRGAGRKRGAERGPDSEISRRALRGACARLAAGLKALRGARAPPARMPSPAP